MKLKGMILGMKKFGCLLTAALFASSILTAVPFSASAANSGSWVPRKYSGEYIEPYKQLEKDGVAVPGALTTEESSWSSGVTWSNPIGKKKFKVKFDFTWLKPKRLTASQKNDFCVFFSYTYKSPEDMDPYVAGNSSTNFTHEPALFRIHANRLICSKTAEGVGGSPTDPDVNPKENGKEIAKIVKTSQNLSLEGKSFTCILECTDGKNVTFTINDTNGQKLADAAYEFVAGYFNDSTPRYFAITQFNELRFTIENFEIVDSDIPESIGKAGGVIDSNTGNTGGTTSAGGGNTGGTASTGGGNTGGTASTGGNNGGTADNGGTTGNNGMTEQTTSVEITESHVVKTMTVPGEETIEPMPFKLSWPIIIVIICLSALLVGTVVILILGIKKSRKSE